MSTITFKVSDQATFDKLVDIIELPESTLEVAETRELVDEYLDTASQALQAAGSSLRLAAVGTHHFLIYLRRSGKQLLATTREYVERLTPIEFAAQQSGDRSHALYTIVATDAPGGLSSILTRRSTFQSKLFRVGDTRFEVGLEAVVYEADGQQSAEQLVQLDLIQGDPEIVTAIAEYLKTEYELELTLESPVARGLRLLQHHQPLVD